jgi:hypothetical protein
MAQLLIIVGFASNWREGPVTPVYAGRDDEEGAKAMADSECTKFIVHRNLGPGDRREKPAVVAPVETELEENADDSGNELGAEEDPKAAKKLSKKVAKK